MWAEYRQCFQRTERHFFQKAPLCSCFYMISGFAEEKATRPVSSEAVALALGKTRQWRRNPITAEMGAVRSWMAKNRGEVFLLVFRNIQSGFAGHTMVPPPTTVSPL